MQTSAKDLSKKQQKQITEQFITLLSDLKSPEESRAFFTAFLTDTEQQVFAKRLAIIWLLHQGLSYEEIRQKLHVSSATISTIASQMEIPGIKVALDKISLDTWAEKWAEKLGRFLPFFK